VGPAEPCRDRDSEPRHTPINGWIAVSAASACARDPHLTILRPRYITFAHRELPE